ncbi:MAG: hypothetical protein M0Z49_00975 [Chloroflexi bacterium]|nr:hypothetical protein [Chloroflexota bacterium]
MRHPDPLIMSADIARVASERPELGEELVQALYQHLVLIEGRQPAIDELRDYVDRLSSLDEHALRQRLGLVARRKRGPRAPAKPVRGRPKGNGLLTAAIVRSNNSALRTELQGRAPTQDALASRLEVSVRTLQDFLKASGLAWPLAD